MAHMITAQLFLPLDSESNASDDEPYQKQLILSLPLETRWPNLRLRQHKGYWLPEGTLPGIIAFHDRFTARPDDVLLASFPKAGTTWLKAAAFATVTRHKYPLSQHPLLKLSPHDCVPFYEIAFVRQPDDTARDLDAAPSPRIVSVFHTPYSMLADNVVESACPIVYLCRDPKDMLVSFWHFSMKIARENGMVWDISFEQAFEQFCEGRHPAGPLWDHAREYWDASLQRPGKVLFLKYEDVMKEPRKAVKRLAEFLKRPFSEQEEEQGVVDGVLDLCSFMKLKDLEANKGGDKAKFVNNDAFFRKGVVGDWRSHMSPEMAEQLDRIVQEKLQGSGLSLTA